ncbi:MAG TPA: hypothetical protein VKT49_06245 [Bryobacteraceae bacterium]|nr:hypothetical protein [Bryobacteraceae bacterium]
MTNELARRIERLERAQGSLFAEKLRALARKLGIEPATLLRAARGNEAELDPQLGAGGLITWPGYLLLRDHLGRETEQRDAQ